MLSSFPCAILTADVTGARADQSRSNSASPPSMVSINRPCDGVVSAHVSPRDLKPAFLAVIAASVFKWITRRQRS